MTEDEVRDIVRSYGIVNADVVVREDIDHDRLLDALVGNRMYIKAIAVVNKVDIIPDTDYLQRVLDDLEKWDPITGMYNCNARWYDPVLARFTGRDPVLGGFKEPLTLHAYLYCLNDPINGIDPTGEMIGAMTLQRAAGASLYTAAAGIAMYAGARMIGILMDAVNDYVTGTDLIISGLEASSKAGQAMLYIGLAVMAGEGGEITVESEIGIANLLGI